MEYTFDLDAAAAFLGVTRSTLYKWLHAGKLPAQKLGRQWRFSREELAQVRDGGREGRRIQEEMEVLGAYFRTRDPRAKEKRVMEKEMGNTSEQVAEALVWDAHAQGVSGIHLQPRKDGVHLLYRVKGGNLEPVRVIEPEAAAMLARSWEARSACVSRQGPRRFFLERQMAQGVSGIQVAYEAVDTLQGRRMTLRILSQDQVFPLGQVCSEAGDRETFARWLSAPNGIILFSGRLGSGKTTTFLSCLQHLARDKARAVFSLEQPIEFRLDGVDQIEVGPEPGALEAAFRKVMYSDLDALGIGIESEAAAKGVLQAARTGHLVLMQLHAVSGEEAVKKLESWVGEPVKDALVGVSWQELVKVPKGGRKAVYTLAGR